MFSTEALKKLSTISSIKTVLDIGCGQGLQSNELKKLGFDVTASDFFDRPKELNPEIPYIQSRFEFLETDKKYDCVWSSHVIEHTLSIQDFINMNIKLCKKEGYICITFPPLKHSIVGGHINLINPGLLLYRLVLAGIDCKRAMIKQYGYNCTVIVQNNSTSIPYWDALKFDNGDIETISPYLPPGYNHQGFNGDIKSLNW